MDIKILGQEFKSSAESLNSRSRVSDVRPDIWNSDTRHNNVYNVIYIDDIGFILPG